MDSSLWNTTVYSKSLSRSGKWLSNNIEWSRATYTSLARRKLSQPGHKGIPGNEIADEIVKSTIHLDNEQEHEIQKSLKTIHIEIFKRADRWINVP